MDIDFSKDNGLVPAIAQDAETGKVLMLAYVNKEAFEYTLKTNKATYWCKGEEAVNYQEIVDILIDCDNDTIIYKVNQKGLKAACHTGYESCFYRHLVNGKWEYNKEPKMFDPDDVYKK